MLTLSQKRKIRNRKVTLRKMRRPKKLRISPTKIILSKSTLRIKKDSTKARRMQSNDCRLLFTNLTLLT